MENNNLVVDNVRVIYMESQEDAKEAEKWLNKGYSPSNLSNERYLILLQFKEQKIAKLSK